MRRKYFLWGGGLLAGAVMAMILSRGQRQELYTVFESPNGRYRLEVYSISGYVSFPGQGGDAPGKVFLKDREGRILKTTKVEMVQLVDNPQWSSNGVKVHLMFEWATPSETK